MKTVKIGNQEWMAENLNVSTFRNGDPIPEVETDEEWEEAGEEGEEEGRPAWCYYENDPANGEKYGKLYNLYAVNDLRGLAPEGWHVPTDDEWQTLEDCLGGRGVAGGKMKESGTAHWDSPNAGVTNESGFSALPGGYREDAGVCFSMGDYARFWSSSESGSSYAWGWYLHVNYSEVGRGYYDGRRGFSVRCVRD